MSGDKTMKQLQLDVDRYIGQYKEGYFQPMEMMARMTEELGELSREVMHQYGPKKKKSSEAENSSEEEMGEVMGGLICMANYMERYQSLARDFTTSNDSR